MNFVSVLFLLMNVYWNLRWLCDEGHFIRVKYHHTISATLFRQVKTLICDINKTGTIFCTTPLLAESNRQQVEKIRRIIEDLGNVVTTPDEAREILALKELDKVNF